MDNTSHLNLSTEDTTPVASAPVQSNPPPAPAIFLPAVAGSGVNVVKKGSGGPKIKWGKGAKVMLAGSILALILLVGGVFAATKLTKKPTNPANKAWTGVSTTPEVIKEISKPETQANLPTQTESASSKMYQKLVSGYPMAEIQNISLPSLSIMGKAYLYYDRLIDKTYVFARLENLPVLTSRIVRLWLSNASKEYVPVGVGEFVKEKEKPVLYSVFVKPGNLKKTYKELIVSYDISVQANAPLMPFLNLKF